MIQIENLKAVLLEIGFAKEALGDYYQKDYGTCIVAVDFEIRRLYILKKKGSK